MNNSASPMESSANSANSAEILMNDMSNNNNQLNPEIKEGSDTVSMTTRSIKLIDQFANTNVELAQPIYISNN